MKEWAKITSDPRILQNMQGLTFEFLEEPSINEVGIKSGQNYPQIMSEVNKLLKKGIVINTAHEKGEFISPIFLRSKADGTNRVIFNLIILYQTLEYNHFRIETIHSVAHLIQQNYYMVKVELKDAYYSVKILEEHTKYLTFFAGSKLLKFVVLPNGLPSGPKRSTKLTKPAIVVLRLEGITIAICIDDLIILGETYEECLAGNIKTIKIFLRSGFLIHPDKSTFLLKQKNNVPRVHI